MAAKTKSNTGDLTVGNIDVGTTGTDNLTVSTGGEATGAMHETGPVNAETDTEHTVTAETDNVHTAPVSQQQTSGEHTFETRTETVDEGDEDGDDEEAPTGRLSYVEMYQRMNPYKPPTDEELERERRKARREKTFAAIGDGIAALSNLFFTTRYAPNAYDGARSLSGKARDRWDKLIKDREANQRQYMQGYMQAMKMDADAAKDDRNWRHTLKRERITDQYKAAAELRAEAKADREAAMADLKMELMLGKIDEQGYRTEKAKIDAEYEEELKRSQISKINRTGTGSSGGGGGGGSTQTWTIVNETTGETKTIYAKSVAHAHNQVPEGWYLRNGDQVTQIETQRGRRGSKSSTSTRSYHTGGSQKKANPMGSGSGTSNNNGGKKKKKNPMS